MSLHTYMYIYIHESSTNSYLSWWWSLWAVLYLSASAAQPSGERPPPLPADSSPFLSDLSHLEPLLLCEPWPLYRQCSCARNTVTSVLFATYALITLHQLTGICCYEWHQHCYIKEKNKYSEMSVHSIPSPTGIALNCSHLEDFTCLMMCSQNPAISPPTNLHA